MDSFNSDFSNALHHVEISDSNAPPSASAPEKRPTFAFHRHISDDPAFTVELLSSPLLHYAAVAKSVGAAIRDLVREWTEKWLAEVGVPGGAGAEPRLRGMVEAVVWGNVIWYVIGGWASRGRPAANHRSPHSAHTSLPQLSSCRRSSSRTHRFLRCAVRARAASRSQVASYYPRRTSPYPSHCTSRAADTRYYPSRSSTWRQTHSIRSCQRDEGTRKRMALRYSERSSVSGRPCAEDRASTRGLCYPLEHPRARVLFDVCSCR